MTTLPFSIHILAHVVNIFIKQLVRIPSVCETSSPFAAAPTHRPYGWEQSLLIRHRTNQYGRIATIKSLTTS